MVAHQSAITPREKEPLQGTGRGCGTVTQGSR